MQFTCQLGEGDLGPWERAYCVGLMRRVDEDAHFAGAERSERLRSSQPESIALPPDRGQGTELGIKHFQHPQRAETVRNMDRFSFIAQS